jgi:hypothetical protein
LAGSGFASSGFASSGFASSGFASSGFASLLMQDDRLGCPGRQPISLESLAPDILLFVNYIGSQ